MEKRNFPRWGLILGGLAAGVINGLLGAGGGVILVFLLRAALGPKAESRDIYASALITTLPITLVSALRYGGAGALPLGEFLPLALPAIAGGIIGALLLDRIHPKIPRRIFAALVIFSGAVMLLR